MWIDKDPQIEQLEGCDYMKITTQGNGIKIGKRLEEKIADIREEMKTAHTFEVQDEAMFNACVEARRHARAILKQFDIDYAEFTRIWDKVKLIKKGEIRGDLVEEVKCILDRTSIFIEEWNNPDTLRKL